jgi:hypothetical protein
MHRAARLDEPGSQGRGPGQDFNHLLAIGKAGRRCDDVRLGDRIGPVGARVRQMRPVRFLPRAIGYVRGEVLRTAATSPATNTTNVSKPGAVKHGRNGSSTRINDPGRLPTRSIGGTLLEEVRRQRRCFFMP